MKTIFTIGFTEKSAEKFFTLLKAHEIKHVLDVRLNNSSQLAGFSKRGDLRFFLKELCNIEYVELRDLAPEPNMLKNYQNKIITWSQYEHEYCDLLSKRAVEKKIDLSLVDHGCMLCSEHMPHQCHRRLAVEYLNLQWNQSLSVKHLY